MDRLAAVAVMTVLIVIVEHGSSLPVNREFLQALYLKRLRRGSPTGNVYDPPIPVFPSKENAPFWNPAPYPVPTTAVPPPYVPHHKLPYYDPNNPYLDAMTDSYWPNLGLGYSNQNPTQIGGGLNWPTGNALMPSDHFNGTLGFANPQQLRVGMQGGPFFPYQNPQYIKTIKDVNDANTLQQVAQMQSATRTMNAVGPAQGTPTGFIPVQQQLFTQQQQRVMPLQQQQFYPVYRQSQAMPMRQPSFSSVSNPFLSSTG